MMRYYIIAVLFFISFITNAQDSISHKIILIGDGGTLINGEHKVVKGAISNMKIDNNTTVIFLGDNVYDKGFPAQEYKSYGSARKVLDSQLVIAKGTNARVYMIPGNHDWENGSSNGLVAVQREAQYVNSGEHMNVRFLPTGGCPGPIEVPVNNDITLVVMDSQWWLHPYDKPGIESECDQKTKSEVLAQLEDIIIRNYKKLVVLACHHPFKSNGIHGGYFGVKQHLFPFTDINKKLFIPLPVIGSIYPIARSVFGTPQDLKHPNYVNMVADVQNVAKAHPHLIFVAGHEHTLQWIKDSTFNYFVSGSGCKSSRVEDSKKSKFTSDELGFITLEISKNKMVRANIFEVTDSTRKVFSDTVFNFSKLPVLAEDTAAKLNVVYKDFVAAPASNAYDSASKSRKAFAGNNYRKEWSTPVKLKVFNINKEKGGLKIVSMGGGKQTKSLELVDSKGKKWALRTIDKDPEKALPANLRGSFAQDIVQDMISAAHPYSPMAIPVLSNAAGVAHATPEYFYVPNDPAFGFYRPLFANKVCMLEAKDASWDGSDTKSTSSIINKIVDDNDNYVDQQAVLKARLLDILISDWDRHFGQWKWGEKDTGHATLYYPIPKDRDQAFFYSDGLLVKYLSRRRIPYIKGLRLSIPKVNELSFTARNFDRLFMNSLGETEWRSTITTFNNAVTNNVITDAVKKMPPEVYGFNGKIITDKLIARRNLLMKEGMKYYRFLAKDVNVTGTNKNETFKITNSDSGLVVTVFSETKKNKDPQKLFERTFDAAITNEIRLYGFNGDDKFEIAPDVKSKIKVRMIGGKGNDTFTVKGNLPNFLYDFNEEQNFATSTTKHTHKYFSPDPLINNYDIEEFNYNVRRYPRLLAGYNADDGLLLGTGLLVTKHGFRKDPYKVQHKLNALFSITNKAYQVTYNGDFIGVYRKIDVVVNAALLNPSLNNFYGLGNNTALINGKNNRFYRARYKYLETDVLVKKRLFNNKLSISAGPTFFNYWNKIENNKAYALGKPSLVGLDSANIYSRKTYAGAKANIILNNLNNELFPTRGVLWSTEFTTVSGIGGNNAKAMTKLTSGLNVFASLSDPARVVAVLRVGGGHIFSDQFEYFQALSLGSNNYLRGFRKNRFAGNSLAYSSIELRVKLAQVRSYILPGQLGLVGFNDIGRVWLKNETSKRWHNAVGGGFYYIPFNLIIISATTGFSDEGAVFNLSVGTRLNLTF
jgi:Calcineurin-like phosphoesterase